LKQKIKILLFCDRPHESDSAATIIDHIDSFKKYSRHEIILWSSLNGLPDERDFSRFDCIVIHYSISLLYDRYVTRETLEKIKSFKGLKILFVQDEYRRVNFACNQINYAQIDMVYTCAPESVSKKMYASLNENIIIHTTLTGYVPEAFHNVKTRQISKRAIDVGYRARKCPFFLGSKGIEKYLIGKYFSKKTKVLDLICDISSDEKDRLYGRDWTNFVSNCKTTLGTESGSSIVDFTGDIEYKLNFYQAFNPFTNFNDVPQKFLKSDGKLEIQVISPRCFEAAALGTVLVLYPGDYSGILIRDRHYIGLEKDFSNINEVVERIKDLDGLQNMANFTKKSLVESGDFSYEKFISSFDLDLDKLIDIKNFNSDSHLLEGDSIYLSLENSKNSDSQSLSRLIRTLFHRIWKIIPDWLRFILMVTILRKKYFCHFNKAKYSYFKNS
jgi:hypothetical protein